MNKILITTVLFVLAVTPAIAADMYVGVKGGIAHHAQSSYQIGGPVLNNNQSGSGIFVGYKLNELYSVEAEYAKLGGFDVSARVNKSSVVAISGVALLPIKKQFSAVGKLGLSKSSLENAAAPGYTGQTVTPKNTSLSLGLGIQYNVTPKTGIQVGIDIYQEGDEYSAMSSASLWYIGGVFKF